jgi:DNA-binding CsgD family transcriptional regulator
MTNPLSQRKNREPFNEDWEKEIAAYDAACDENDREFRNRNLVVGNPGCPDLTPEENEVFELVLKGIPCSEIAERFGVEESLIIGLIEVIRAKLSISD